MARRSRYMAYAEGMKGGQAAKPALSVKGGSIKERLALMKEKSKVTSKDKGDK